MNLDLSTQYININNKLFEVYAMYENKFDNLTNEQTQQIQHQSKKRFS